MQQSQIPTSTVQASFVCQCCSQPPKLDHVTIQELTAPSLAPAQEKPGETQGEEANSGEELFIETCWDGLSGRFIPQRMLLERGRGCCSMPQPIRWV
uniref:Uncharacterized protein n=1 Tax=Equus asinus TaxID=9793 RepID=A0A9L0IB16_EQUAS